LTHGIAAFWLRNTKHGVAEREEDAAMTIADVVAAVTGERVFGSYTGGDPHPSREEIARLAYQFYDERGRHDGQDVSDWLAAEEELTRHYR
jgi:hypothetical protein